MANLILLQRMMTTTVIVIIVIACVAFVAGTGIFICCSLSHNSHKFKLKTPRLNTAKRRSQFVRGLRPSLAEKGEIPRPKSAGAVEGGGRRSRMLEMKEMPRRVSEISISYHQRMELMHRIAMTTIREDEPDLVKEGDGADSEKSKDERPETDKEISGEDSCMGTPSTILTLESETTQYNVPRKQDHGVDGNNDGSEILKTKTNVPQDNKYDGRNIDYESQTTSEVDSRSVNTLDLFTTNKTRSTANRKESLNKKGSALPEITSSRINLVTSAASVEKENPSGSKADNSKSRKQRTSSRRKRNRIAVDPDIVKQNKNELNSYHDT